MQISDLRPGYVLSNDQIHDIFGCSKQGGMRKSNRTQTLILVSNYTKSLFYNRWDKDVFYYTGMGSVGDQYLTYSQNKTLAESKENGFGIHLFECYVKGEYTYVGQMVLADLPFKEDQLDEKGNIRKVYIFPLKSISDFYYIKKENIELIEKNARTRIQQLSDKQLAQKVSQMTSVRSQRLCVTTNYGRNIYLSSWVKRKAKGICQFCLQDAPFKSANGEPFLEIHHIQWLSKGGADSLNNMIALCPNCHRKMHHVNDKHDVKFLKQQAKKVTQDLLIMLK
ncbi:HNH endonuclease [Commensalibacter oyaizuii]|uniref:HNH endonuclease n=1 Tax=Commensalibacter oyaizuii TaxID=3043873 RepID=A0ABT6Q4N8_9PROT|nr:HNH endonuclease [Commensalibacter sp. TBRC 16381]MDI2091526.1 HNH endonuclease [Commensalibacter sp. TBRC 16381]